MVNSSLSWRCCLETSFGGRFLLLIIDHPDSSLRSPLYILTLLKHIITAGFTHEMYTHLFNSRDGWAICLQLLVELEGRSRAAQPCESAGLQKSDAVELLPSFSGSFDSSHCGIFGANFPKPLAGAVDSW